jgi:hypothetical protein
MLRLCFAALPLLAHAAACAAGDCDSPSAGRVLLQSSSGVRQLKVLQVSDTDTDSFSAKVQALISDVVATKRRVLPEEETALNLMKETLTDITFPGIVQGHLDDQILMDAAHASLATCNTNLDTESADVAMLKSDSVAKSNQHVVCRSNESALASDNLTKWQSLSGYVDTLDEPQMPSGILNLHDFFQNGLTWYSENKDRYTSMKQTYTNASVAWLAKKEECNQAQATAESSDCQWHASSTDAISNHELCWDQRSASFITTQAALIDSSDNRKAEWTAAKKLLCFVSALNGSIETIQERLDACINLVVSTSSLDLTNTAPPIESSVTHLGDLSLQPGDAAWETQAYGELSFNSPAAAVTACYAPTPEVATASLMLEGDYATLVTNKTTFLTECSAALAPVTCVNVQPGSIIVTLEATSDDEIRVAQDQVASESLDLPSFPVFEGLTTTTTTTWTTTVEETLYSETLY